MSVTLAKVLDRVASTPSLVRKLGNSGSMKIVADGIRWVVPYTRFDNGNLSFSPPVSEGTSLRPKMKVVA